VLVRVRYKIIATEFTNRQVTHAELFNGSRAKPLGGASQFWGYIGFPADIPYLAFGTSAAGLSGPRIVVWNADVRMGLHICMQDRFP